MDATRIERLMWGLGGLLVGLYALIPVAWIVSLSLKPGADLGDQRFWPQQISLEHYAAIFQDPQFSAALINSFGIAGISTLLAVLMAMYAAYAISSIPLLILFVYATKPFIRGVTQGALKA